DPHDLAEARPSRIVDSGDTYIAVAGSKSAPDAVQKWMTSAGTLRFFAGHRSIVQLESLHRDHRAVNRCVDPLPLSGTLAWVQCSKHTSGQSQCPSLIGDGSTGRERRIARHPGLGH